uniref:Guanine nucleotide-binding protein subunit gamma n=2 Tax=Sphaeramia orbicularis TaxID=375764 RepID=A0A673A7M9_9TELE
MSCFFYIKVIYKTYFCVLTARMARDMSDKEILKMELDQLKKEVSTPRTPVGANCAETIAWVEERAPNDPLIKGVPDDKNPYKGDKGGCIVT